MAHVSSTEERRQLIIREAARLFTERGYYRTSMEDIAAAVGLRKPTLYWYISGKEEILFHIHNEFVDMLITKHQQRVGSGMSNSELLRLVMYDVFDQFSEYPGYVSSFHEHYHDLSQELQKQMEVKRDSYFTAVTEIVRQGVAAGEFQAGDPNLTTLAFFGLCNWVYKWYRNDGPLQPREIADQFWVIFMEGVRKK